MAAQGVSWTDAYLAGGGGDAARTAQQGRIVSNKPSAATLMPGQIVVGCAAEGLTGHVDARAAAEDRDVAVLQAAKECTKVAGHDVWVLTRVYRTDKVRAGKAAFAAIGSPCSTAWEELTALEPRFAAAGIIALADGGQSRQEVYRFEAVATGVGGADSCCKAPVDPAHRCGPVGDGRLCAGNVGPARRE